MNDGFTLTIPPETIDALADQLVGRLGEAAPAPAEPYLNVDQAAEYLACKPKRIYDLVERGVLPCYRDGKRLLFKRNELDAYLSQ